MNSFNDEVCEYNYSTSVTENFVTAENTKKLNNEKTMHNQQVNNEKAMYNQQQYNQCNSNCSASYWACQMYKTESSFDWNKCMTNCQNTWYASEK